MKLRMISSLCTLCLLFFCLPGTAMAESTPHSCTDKNTDFRCDTCGSFIEHTCIDSDGDYYCDPCGEWIEHECIDEDMDCYCDLCLWYIYHDCIDMDGDWYCETCGHWMDHTCIDTDENWFCDQCRLGLPVNWRLTVFAEGTGTISCDFGGFRDDIKDGVASYWWINAGQYRFTASKPGFVSREINVTIDPDNTQMRFKLLPAGDVNGDGVTDIVDVAKVYACTKGSLKIEDDYLCKCGDVSNDGQLTIADVAQLYSHVKGTKLL